MRWPRRLSSKVVSPVVDKQGWFSFKLAVENSNREVKKKISCQRLCDNGHIIKTLKMSLVVCGCVNISIFLGCNMEVVWHCHLLGCFSNIAIHPKVSDFLVVSYLSTIRTNLVSLFWNRARSAKLMGAVVKSTFESQEALALQTVFSLCLQCGRIALIAW